MKVLTRSQITQVITERIVFHTLELNEVIYQRLETFKVILPYMDCKAVISDPTIKWCIVNGNVHTYLTKKEVKTLRLNELFEDIKINEKNGNG